MSIQTPKEIALTREVLIILVKGSMPNYSAMGHQKIKNKGVFYDQHATWEWNRDVFESCSDDDLFEIYVICGESWKK